jgi:hypothetical protein
MKPTIVSVSVDYADTLAIAGKSWRRLTDDVVVATVERDKDTLQVCRDLDFTCILAPGIHHNGHPFNKGKGLNKALSVVDKHGWILQLDADTVLPEQTVKNLQEMFPDPWGIYGAVRCIVPGRDAITSLDPFEVNPKVVEPGRAMAGNFTERVVAGYFQLYHSDYRKMHHESYRTAEAVDIEFSKQWPAHKRFTFLQQVLVYHLGPTVVNWKGRKSPAF